MNNKIKLLTLLFLFITSCQESVLQGNKSENDTSFNEFYERFITDSSFQISRIKFPLKGKYLDGESLSFDDTLSKLDYTWNIENWDLIQKVDVLDDPYELNQIETDTLIVRKTIGKGIGFRFEETYSKIRQKWYLTYLVSIDI